MAGGDNVLSLLSIIQSDYKRTVRVTTKDEKDAAADFIKFERETKVAIMSSETLLLSVKAFWLLSCPSGTVMTEYAAVRDLQCAVCTVLCIV